MDEKSRENKWLKQLIITNNRESINGSKAVCPLSHASRVLYNHAQKQCEKGLFALRISECRIVKYI